MIEVVVVSAIICAVSLSYVGALATLSRFHQKNMYAIKGGLLAEEAIEAVRYASRASWAKVQAVPPNTTRYVSLNGSTWNVVTTPEIVDGFFYRSFKVYTVYRNSTDDIVASGGTADTDTLLIQSFVSWNWRGATSTASYQTYVTRL